MGEPIFMSLSLDELAQRAAPRSEPLVSDFMYIVSAAVIAAVIIIMSFGVGFYLLARPAAQIFGDLDPRGGSEVKPLHSIVFPELSSGGQSVSVEVEFPYWATVTSLSALAQSSPTTREEPTPENTDAVQSLTSPATEPALSAVTAGLHRTFADQAEARSRLRGTLDFAGSGTGTVTPACKDGTSFTGTKRSKACRGHGGVQSWGGAAATRSLANPPAAQPTPTASRRVVPAPTGSGQVWVNTASKVYHCPGTRWYGNTMQGSYMSEVQAQAQGARQDHGKKCFP